MKSQAWTGTMTYLEPPPPPQREDVLFAADDTLWKANACIARGDELFYREGYRRGARLLAECVCRQASEQDFLIFPIVYLYRHHVELALKRLLPVVAGLAGEDPSPKCVKDLEKHRIDELWNNCRHLLNTEKFGKEVRFHLEAMDGIDSYIRQLSDIDPDSQAFRFPRRKTGDVTLPEGLTHINVAVFSDYMESLCSYLDDLCSWLDHVREMKDQMEEHYRNEKEKHYRSQMYAEYQNLAAGEAPELRATEPDPQQALSFAVAAADALTCSDCGAWLRNGSRFKCESCGGNEWVQFV